MAVRDKSAALDELGADIGQEPLRGEKTTIDDSYLDGLSSRLESDPKLVLPPVAALPPERASSLEEDEPADPPMPATEPPRRMPVDEDLGSFDSAPIPSEPTNVEDDDELAGSPTRIFLGGDEAAGRAGQVEVVAGRDRGKVFVLTAETTGVGRGIDNDFILTDIAASRRHMKIHKHDGYYELEDLGSGNGTLRNGRRIQGRVVLLNGDKIELGNTTLMFAWDGAPPVGMVEGTAELVMPSGTTTPMAGAVPRASTEIGRPRPSTPGGSNKLILFGGITVAIVMVAVIVIVKLTMGPSVSDAPAGPSIAELQTTGVNAYRARQWDTALRAFEQLAALSPADPSVHDYITRCHEERVAEQALTQARMLAASSPRDAITALGGIPATSVYAQDAAGLRSQAVGHRVTEIVTMIEAARQREPADRNRVLALVDEGLALDPANAALQQVRSDVGGPAPASGPAAPVASVSTPPSSAPSATIAIAPAQASSTGETEDRSRRGRDRSRGSEAAVEPRGAGRREATPREAAPREAAPREAAPREATPREATPREATATNSKVLQLFKSGRFRDAADAATSLAESSTGAAADQARSLARDIDRFSQAWSAAQTSADLPAKIRNLESALRLDRAVTGGHYASQIQPLLVRAHADHAGAAWGGGRFASACQSVQAALRLDPRNATATTMSRDCATKARQFYEEANSVRTQDPDRARELWRQVIQMVSRDNEWYTRAYERLNNSQGPARDEDE